MQLIKEVINELIADFIFQKFLNDDLNEIENEEDLSNLLVEIKNYKFDLDSGNLIEEISHYLILTMIANLDERICLEKVKSKVNKSNIEFPVEK